MSIIEMKNNKYRGRYFKEKKQFNVLEDEFDSAGVSLYPTS